MVIIDCVAIFYEEGEGGEHYRKKNKFRWGVYINAKFAINLLYSYKKNLAISHFVYSTKREFRLNG